MNLDYRSGGDDGPLIAFLHGLGATAGVWAPLLQGIGDHWQGRWLAIDLPGHGASDRLPRYDNQDYAAAVAPLIARVADGQKTALFGHSLGGTVALTLATGRFGFAPNSVHAIGIKVDWSEEELDRFASLAERAPRLFTSEEEALAMHARYAGLAADAEAPLLRNGAIAVDDCWRAALDLRAFAVVPPDMERLASEAKCPVYLACGAEDPMVSADRLRDHDRGAISFAGCGHNAMVDDPAAVWNWFEQTK